jgi:lipopolysaccharide transport system ATP-binding protein
MSNDEVLVKVEGLSKKFCKDLKTSLWYGVKDLFASVTGRHNDGLLRPKEFWAVKDISFELKRGECLGLIGHNGAGKSTLLKILNGLINPDEGKITIRGRVGALIELGAGFNPILSGRENIYNNGAILGFTKKEIDFKVEEIIDFAEIREFIDMPVQNYSSGMRVRLGFAVAAQMEPDVLIIDEVLAVGDIGFRIKCLNEINNLLPKTAVILVSHSMPQIAKISTHVLMMDNGTQNFLGKNISKGIECYFDKFKGGNYSKIEKDFKLEKINGGIEEDWVDPHNNYTKEINYLDDLVIGFQFFNGRESEKLGYIIRIFDRSLISVATCQNKFDGSLNSITIKIPKLQLAEGTYDLDVYFVEFDDLENEIIRALYKNIITLRVKQSIISNYSSFQLISEII